MNLLSRLNGLCNVGSNELVEFCSDAVGEGILLPRVAAGAVDSE